MVFKGITPREWYITVAMITACLALFSVQAYRTKAQNTQVFRSKQTAKTNVISGNPIPNSPQTGGISSSNAVPVLPVASNANSPNSRSQSAGLLAANDAESIIAETGSADPSTSGSNTTGSSPAFENGLLNINRATAKDFEALPGVGPVKSESIVAYREKIGGAFTSIQQLDDVSGIGPKTLERLSPMLFVPEQAVTQTRMQLGNPALIATNPPSSLSTATESPTKGLVNINTAGLEELQILSGIGEKKAEDILRDRQLNGPFKSVDDLQRVPGIGPKTIEKNRHLITLRTP